MNNINITKAEPKIAKKGIIYGPKILLEKISEYINRRDVLIEGLNNIEGIICPKPKGAFYAIAQLPIDDAGKFAQWLLEDFDLNGETIMVAPAAGFYSTPNTGINQVRIAYVLNVDALQSAINILEAAIKVYPGKTL